MSLDLFRFFRRQAIVRAVLLSRLQASLRAASASRHEVEYEPDICEPPTDFQGDEEWDLWRGRYQ